MRRSVLQRALRPGDAFEPDVDQEAEARAVLDSARPHASALLTRAKVAIPHVERLVVLVTVLDEHPMGGDRFEATIRVVDRAAGAAILRRLPSTAKLGRQLQEAPPKGHLWAVVGFESGHAFSFTVPASHFERGMV
jgi:hypothetical protein